MHLDVIDNSGATSMIAELRKEIGTCRSARLATASLTRGGIRFIEEALRRRRSNLHIQLLVGLYNGHTEAAALRRLLRMQKLFGEQIETRIARNARFHWKTYVFESKAGVVAFVGSSNLTNDGLDVEGEFNIRINSPTMGGVLGHITETFDRVWKKNSFPLNVGTAEAFSSASNQSRNATLEIYPIINGILRPTRRSSPRKAPKDTTIMTSIEEFAGRATIKAVRDKTDWYRRGWEWMVFRRRADRDRLFEPGAFYSAEIKGKSLSISLNDVCDEDEFKTDDGQYLIAYQRRRGSVSRRVSSSVLALLKEAGVARTAKDLLNDQRLSRPKREMLNSLLKVPKSLSPSLT